MSAFANKMAEVKEQLDGSNIPKLETPSDETKTLFVDSPFAQQTPNEPPVGTEDDPKGDDPKGDEPKGDDPKGNQDGNQHPEILKELFEDFDGNVDALKERVKTYKQRSTEYEQITQKVKEYEEVIPKVKAPWANDTVKALNSFIAKTGIQDLSVAASFAGKKADEIVKSPIDALALRQVVLNPDVLKMASMEDIKESLATQFGVTSDVKIEDSPVALKIAVGEAAKDLETKLSATEEGDIFDKLAGERTTREQSYQQYLSAITPKVGEIVNSLSELKFDFDGGASFSLQVSDKVKQQLEGEMRSYVASQGLDITPEFAAQLQQAATQRAKEIMVDDLLQTAVKQTKGEALKGVMKEVENGKPIDRNGTQVAKPKESGDDWAKNWLASKGKKV